MNKVIVIAGVTGSGKTNLSIELSKHLDIEIINADSVSIYKELDIGSAKVSLEEQKIVTHHLVDTLPIEASWSVAQFQQEGRRLIEEISTRQKIPVIVGGTGLYINALVNDYEFIEEDTKSYEDSRTNEQLLAIIKRYDKSLDIHVNNRQRLLRLVYKIEHNLMEDKTGSIPVYDALIYFIAGDREQLYQRINTRVDRMFDLGLLDEIETLMKKYPNFFELSSTKAIGYREFEAYYKGDLTLDQVRDKIKQNTRRFAKRQITWFKHQTPSIELSFDAIDIEKIVSDIHNHLED